ncbi:MAG: thioesterase family protein [Cyanobacteria bacterium J06597_16]
MLHSDVSATTPSEKTNWYEYPIRVQPHHTDYGGVVWHGTYVTWLESARVECLRAVGAPFDELVASGYDLPVVGIDIRYRQPLTLGQLAVVKTRLAPVKGIRLNWVYEIETKPATPEQDNAKRPSDLTKPQVCVTGQVTLVTVSMRDRKVVRRLPPAVSAVVQKVTEAFGPEAHI